MEIAIADLAPIVCRRGVLAITGPLPRGVHDEGIVNGTCLYVYF